MVGGRVVGVSVVGVSVVVGGRVVGVSVVGGRVVVGTTVGVSVVGERVVGERVVGDGGGVSVVGGRGVGIGCPHSVTFVHTWMIGAGSCSTSVGGGSCSMMFVELAICSVVCGNANAIGTAQSPLPALDSVHSGSILKITMTDPFITSTHWKRDRSIQSDRASADVNSSQKRVLFVIVE